MQWRDRVASGFGISEKRISEKGGAVPFPWTKEKGVYKSVYKTVYRSPLGELTLASDGENLCGLWLEGQKYFAGTIKEEMKVCPELNIFLQTVRWLDRYFAHRRPEIGELPLSPVGSVFRQTVWTLLCEIPYGEMTTYGEIAKKTAAITGRRVSARAVGGAVGHNPISIIIPCHRVVGSNGHLTGYAGGVEKKIWLLEHEGMDLTNSVR